MIPNAICLLDTVCPYPYISRMTENLKTGRLEIRISESQKRLFAKRAAASMQSLASWLIEAGMQKAERATK